jgi:hypothetical protein
MGMSAYYGGRGSDDDGIAVIRHALDRGVTLLDTADVYGPHTNEVLVGRAIAGRRNQVFLASKFGIGLDPADPKARQINGHRDYVQAACEASLRRLGVDHIDLYYQHRVDPTVPIEDTVGAMARLVEQGRCAGWACPRPRRPPPPRPCGAPDHGGAERVLAVVARAGAERSAGHHGGAGHRLRAVFAAGPWLPDRRHPQPDDFDADDYRRTSPRFEGENFQHPWHWWTPCRRWPPSAASPPRSWRWPGCCRAAGTSCRSRARRGGHGWTRTSAALQVELDAATLDALDAAFRCMPRPANAIRSAAWPASSPSRAGTNVHRWLPPDCADSGSLAGVQRVPRHA